MATSPVIIVAALFVHPGQEDAFAAFETQAARIMHRYGGRIERVIRPTRALPESALPDEIHVVVFPSSEAFERYRADPALVALAAARDAAIAQTQIIVGYPAAPYS